MRDFKSKDVDGLYPQQRKCHNALDAWWKTDSKFFVLRGYDGTGLMLFLSFFKILVRKLTIVLQHLLIKHSMLLKDSWVLKVEHYMLYTVLD